MIPLPAGLVTTPSMVDSELMSLSSLVIKVTTKLLRFLTPIIKLLIIEEMMEQILFKI